MRSIREIKDLEGKAVLVRVDFNVPIKDGKVEDDFRIIKTLPTIDFLLKKGAKKIVLITHLGKDGSANLEGVIERFWEVSKFPKDKIEFFENVRKFPGEEKNDPVFAKHLASLGDIYVNDAFPVSHRVHASIVGITKYLPSYAGLQLEEEVKNLSRAFEDPKHPFLFILGGAKFETKLPLIEKYIKTADNIFIGGAMLNDFLKVKGFEVGVSLVSEKTYGIKEISENKKLIIPEHVVVKTTDEKFVEKNASEVSATDNIIDVGSKAVKMIEPYIKDAKLIVWNGPLGKYENHGGKATKEVLKIVLKSEAQIIIGGGDIVSILSSLEPRTYELKPNLFISTGGGATLDFLANGTLPGIKALE